MKRLRWYVARARAMSMPELAHRVREALRKALYRVAPPNLKGATLVWTGNARTLADIILGWGEESSVCEAWRVEAEKAVAEGPLIFGFRWPMVGDRPHWHAALPGNTPWPQKYCFDIDFRSPAQGREVRLTWEVNRLLWLVPIAALAAQEGDTDRAEWCAAVLLDWIDSHPPFVGVAWATGIECALQVVAVATVEELLGRVSPNDQRRSSVATAIAIRADWIRRFPSRYSSANNHAIAELAGRLVGALVVEDDLSSDAPGELLKKLQEEFAGQHCRDGLNAEHAPHYGLFVLELAALCAQLCQGSGIAVDEGWLSTLNKSAEVLDVLQDGGGHLLCFGDDDGSGIFSGSLPHAVEIEKVLALTGYEPQDEALKSASTVLGEDWYSIYRSSDSWGRTMWTIDHAPLGFGRLAAHGHADALSVWMSIDYRPVFVEAGTFLYHSDEKWRSLFRSTAVHNTVTLGHQSSSRMAGAFNWSQSERAVCRIRSRADGTEWMIEAEHDGYVKSLGARHIRRVSRTGNAHFTIEDRIDGESLVPMEFSLLLAPDIRCTPLSDGWILERDGKALAAVRFQGEFDHRIESGNPSTGQGWISSSFYSKEPTTQLLVTGHLGMTKGLKVDITAIPDMGAEK